MIYLGLALFAEGPSDHRFLRPVLRRVCETICLARARGPAEVSDVLELHSPDRVRGGDREMQILEAARDARGAWTLLLVHADGGSDPQRALLERVEPAFERVSREFGNDRGRGVAVVPVRETEAWTLADGNALRGVFGTSLTDDDLGLPASPRRAEQIADPKKVLDRAWQAVRRPRQRVGAASFLEALGERVSLEILSACLCDLAGGRYCRTV